MSTNVTSSNLPTVKRIGAGERLCVSATSDIVATLPEGFDPDKRGAVAEAVHLWACGDGPREAVKKGRAGEQVATDYGRGVDALIKSVKRALRADDDKPLTLRANMSGGTAEDVTGSVTIPADHPLYAALVALIREDAGE